MSSLRSALDELAVDSSEDLSIEDLRDQIVELAHCGQRIDVLIAERTRALAQQGGHAAMGYPSPSISRIVLGPDAEILDIGRKRRVWTAAQRRAIIARDRRCQAAGCPRSPRWCDIHHTDHWADGGTTSVDKGRLFCRFHHTTEHLKEAHRRRTMG